MARVTFRGLPRQYSGAVLGLQFIKSACLRFRDIHAPRLMPELLLSSDARFEAAVASRGNNSFVHEAACQTKPQLFLSLSVHEFLAACLPAHCSQVNQAPLRRKTSQLGDHLKPFPAPIPDRAILFASSAPPAAMEPA